MVRNKCIFLIGPMGAGKTSVGLELSKLLKVGFVDTDRILELRMQKSARQIIESHGESFLRQQEAAILIEASAIQPGVVATGGGCVVLEANRKLLQKLANVCYLLASPRQQLLRLAQEKERGLLPSDQSQRLSFFQKMLQQRQTLYESITTTHINTDNYNVSEVTQQILKLIDDYAVT